MEFTAASSIKKRKEADVLLLPFTKGKKRAEEAFGDAPLIKMMAGILKLGDFKGNESEILLTYCQGEPEKRVVLVGLGEQDRVTAEVLRRAYSEAASTLRKKSCQSVNVVLPELPFVVQEDVILGIVEGISLTNYSYDKLKCDTLEGNPMVLLKKVCLIGGGKNTLEQAKRLAKIADAVHFTRDLVNGNADDIHPQYLADAATKLSKQFPKVKTTVFDRKRIEQEKMGLLLAVNRGSHTPPAFIIIAYKGNAKSKDHTVIIGKGITYDTGGLNLKSAGMEQMKCDMGGAATVLGTMKAVAELGLPVNITGVIPATENSISSGSYKPGDVYKSYSGKTVEIVNTDAEGRLVLADALAYADKNLKPTRMIDFATLTGAIEITLGGEASGLMSNNDALSDQLIRAGSATFERVWRLPLYDEYKSILKSDFADLKNWNGRSASSIVAAVFLQQFVGKTNWAHLDIASTAYLGEAKRYQPKFGTGVGVRLMIEFLENI